MTDFAGLFLKALEAIGIARDTILARIEGLKAKYPDGDIPLSEIENVINQHLSSQNIAALVAGAAVDLKNLVQTGQSAITEDPSSLA